MASFSVEDPVTPPPKSQSSLRQQHRHQDRKNYASPPRTPMWRSEPPTPAANTSRKRGREKWAPETPTSLPRRKRGQDAAALSAEWAVGDGHNTADENSSVGPKIGHAHSTRTGEAIATEDFPANEKQYIGFAVHWDADVIGVVCPFCMDTEIHLMRCPSNTADVDLRVPDCDPGQIFRLLFAGDDHPAVKGRSGIWVEERSRWESVYVEDLCSEESEQGSEVEKGEEGPICSGDQNHGDHIEVLEDIPEDQGIIPSEGVFPLADDTGLDLPIYISSDDEDEEGSIYSRYEDHGDPMEVMENIPGDQIISPSEGVLPLTADTGLDLPIALSSDGEDEAMADEPTPKESTQILRIASRLFNNPPAQYLTLGHGQAVVVYRPVAVIPVPGALEKTVGFLAPAASSTRRVFTRSGWKGEEISDADIAWLQGILATPKEEPWQGLRVINNRDYTEKVRELSAHLGIEPRQHNYDKEYPLGQVYFSHVEKQLVVVALEEHQSSGHLTSTESPPKRTIHLNRAPCVGCLDFAKAVEHLFGLRFEFNVMARVMSEEQARAKFRNLDSGKGGMAERRVTAQMRRTLAAMATKDPGGQRGRGEQVPEDTILENQLNGLYAGELDVVREMTGKTGEKRYLVEWEDSWMSQKELGNSKRLIEDYEGRRRLLE
ncbi:hypothetical protein ACLOAV_007394 [Pseudogymnoascus australis]